MEEPGNLAQGPVILVSRKFLEIIRCYSACPRDSYFIIGVKGSEVRFGSMHLRESNTGMDRYPEVCNGEEDMLG